MRIKSNWFRRHGVCEEGMEWFFAVYPDKGIEINGEYFKDLQKLFKNHPERLMQSMVLDSDTQIKDIRKGNMNQEEINKRLTAIENSTKANEQAIQEIRKELDKPKVDWCVGMWVKGAGGTIGYIAIAYGDGSCDIRYIGDNYGYDRYTKKELNDNWTPIPYPYQEFLKVGDRVEANGKKGTITKIDGTVTPIKILFDENIGSSSWYEIQQLIKIGEGK